uniref:Transmembrane protein 135 N-terminal domain-containing protein n=1 Tax=Globisporangium ultimum (strain ATCC 200006 / CBS 805.95 / DAOM BR144) TaxID=431595 RepID=K3W754_GLOUD
MERMYSAVFPDDMETAGFPAPSDTECIVELTAEALAQHNSKTLTELQDVRPLDSQSEKSLTARRHLSSQDTFVDEPLPHFDDSNGSSEDVDAVADTEDEAARALVGATPKAVVRDLKAALRAALRAFLYAYGAKAFTALLLAARKWSSFRSGATGALRQLVETDTLRFGAFVGSLVGAFRVTEIAARIARGTKDQTNLAIAGAVSGLTLLVDSKARRTTVSLYIFMRMLDVVGRHLTAAKVLPAWKYSTEWIFALSNAAIMYGVVIQPVTVAKGYYNWMLSTAGLTDFGLEHTFRERLLDVVDANGVPIPFRACQPHYHAESCIGHSAKEWVGGIGRTARVYFPVHFLPALIFKLQQLRASPVASVTTLTLAALRSCVFLTSYQTVVKLVMCAIRNTWHRDFHMTGWSSGFIAGWTLLLESPKRRSELTLYCGLRGMEIVWRLLKLKGLVRYVQHSEVALFSLSMALIMSSPPAHVKPTYLRLLRFLFGQNAI